MRGLKKYIINAYAYITLLSQGDRAELIRATQFPQSTSAHTQTHGTQIVYIKSLLLCIFSIDSGGILYTGSSREDLELSRFFSRRRKEKRFLTNVPTPLLLFSVDPPSEWLLSRSSCLFVYFCSLSFFFFFTLVYISVHQRVITFRFNCPRRLYVRFVFCATSLS